MFRLGNTLLNLPGRRTRDGVERGRGTEDNLPPQSLPGERAIPKTPREMCHPKAPLGNLSPQSPPNCKGVTRRPRCCPYRPVGAGEKVPLNPHLVTRRRCATKPFRSPAAPSNSCTTTGQERPTKPWEVLRGLRIRPRHGKRQGMEEKHGRELQSLLCPRAAGPVPVQNSAPCRARIEKNTQGGQHSLAPTQNLSLGSSRRLEERLTLYTYTICESLPRFWGFC